MGLSFASIHIYISITPNQKKKKSSSTSGKQNQKLKEQLRKFLNDPSYRPLNKSELARALELTPKHRQQLRKIITAMESEGMIRKIKKGRYVKRGGAEVIGIIRFNPNGHAFVDPESFNKESSVFIPKGESGTALHGDKVVAKILNQGRSPQWTKHIKNTQTTMQNQCKPIERRCKSIAHIYVLIYIRRPLPVRGHQAAGIGFYLSSAVCCPGHLLFAVQLFSNAVADS